MTANTTILPQSHVAILEDGDHPLPEAQIDDGDDVVNLDEAPAAAAAPAAPAKKKAVAAADGDDLPAELRGKSQKELAKMYREAQSLIGRQGSELGELRRTADMAIQTSLGLVKSRDAAPAAAAAPAAKTEVDEVDFFRDPSNAVAKAIENSPIIKQIKETMGQAARDQAVSRATAATERFNVAHPDALEIMQDPGFRNWVGASRVRTALLQRAHAKFDFDAGDEIFGTWKALNKKPAVAAADEGADEAADAAAASAAAAVLAKRKRALAAAAVPTGGNGASTPGTGAKKVYRRADVLRLMETDNERYLSMADDLALAYKEGRVR